MHRADWSTVVPGGVGMCHYPVSKARNTIWDHIIKVVVVVMMMMMMMMIKRRYYFHPDNSH
jgi:hypothetical protein